MHKHLYFICPTDHLETILDAAFSEENYFFTSLGNAVTFDRPMLNQIQKLLASKEIKEVSFVLSDDNRIALDALGHHQFSKLRGADGSYYDITQQKKWSEELWQSCNYRFSVLSNYLNTKIKELSLGLETFSTTLIKINGKIYSRQTERFSSIYADLTCGECFSLN